MSFRTLLAQSRLSNIGVVVVGSVIEAPVLSQQDLQTLPFTQPFLLLPPMVSSFKYD